MSKFTITIVFCERPKPMETLDSVCSLQMVTQSHTDMTSTSSFVYTSTELADRTKIVRRAAIHAYAYINVNNLRQHKANQIRKSGV